MDGLGSGANGIVARKKTFSDLKRVGFFFRLPGDSRWMMRKSGLIVKGIFHLVHIVRCVWFRSSSEICHVDTRNR